MLDNHNSEMDKGNVLFLQILHLISTSVSTQTHTVYIPRERALRASESCMHDAVKYIPWPNSIEQSAKGLEGWYALSPPHFSFLLDFITIESVEEKVFSRWK